MAGKLTKDNFGYLGVDFQHKLIKIFIEDVDYFIDYQSIINQNAFTNSYLRTIVGTIKDYFADHDTVPGYDTLLILLRSKASTEDDIQYFDETVETIRKSSIEGLEEVGNIAERFFRQQEMIKVANKIKEVVGTGDLDKYDECCEMWEHINSIKRRDSETSTPFENMEDDLSKQSIVSIPTGVGPLDDALGGGLDKGKIGLIIGSMGFGKTSMTTCFAANAATYKCEQNEYGGFKVLQIIFEDTHRDIHRKYMAKVSQIETRNLNQDEETPKRVLEILRSSEERQMMDDNIRIMRLPTGEKSATDIKTIIKTKITEGFYPDLVIVDYFGCVAPERGMSNKDVTEREGTTMRKFETMAADLDIAMWIPVQGNRDSIMAELVTNDKISGSITKNQIAQVVLSITRSVDDQYNNKATISLLKNRSGLGGVTLNGVTFNNGTCTISCNDAVDFDNPLVYNEYASDKEAERMENMVRESRGTYKLRQTESGKTM